MASVCQAMPPRAVELTPPSETCDLRTPMRVRSLPPRGRGKRRPLWFTWNACIASTAPSRGADIHAAT